MYPGSNDFWRGIIDLHRCMNDVQRGINNFPWGTADVQRGTNDFLWGTEEMHQGISDVRQARSWSESPASFQGELEAQSERFLTDRKPGPDVRLATNVA
jgi:hypothetical protein